MSAPTQAPTAVELLAELVVRAAMEQARVDSLPDDPQERHEEGAWIYVDLGHRPTDDTAGTGRYSGASRPWRTSRCSWLNRRGDFSYASKSHGGRMGSPAQRDGSEQRGPEWRPVVDSRRGWDLSYRTGQPAGGTGGSVRVSDVDGDDHGDSHNRKAADFL